MKIVDPPFTGSSTAEISSHDPRASAIPAPGRLARLPGSRVAQRTAKCPALTAEAQHLAEPRSALFAHFHRHAGRGVPPDVPPLSVC